MRSSSLGVGHVGADEVAADLVGQRLAGVVREVDDHDPRALGGQPAAVAAPIPLAPPVTTATRSFRLSSRDHAWPIP